MGKDSGLNNFFIRELTTVQEINNSTKVIRESFHTVAEKFGLTKENCPTHTSFITFEKLKSEFDLGVKMYGLFMENNQIGFVAIVRDGNDFVMEKLAIIPEYRNQGFGKKLMDFVFDYIKDEKGKKLAISIIEENQELKRWYQNYGFKEIGIKKFEHLPFTVGFLEKDVI